MAGGISGMGMGGGTVLIPALVFIAGISQREAQVFNLLYFIPTAVAALIAHIKNRNIKWRILPGLLTLGVVGAIIGASVALYIDETVLRRCFAVFLAFIGLIEVFRKKA